MVFGVSLTNLLIAVVVGYLIIRGGLGILRVMHAYFPSVISIICTSPAGAICNVFKNDAHACQLIPDFV